MSYRNRTSASSKIIFSTLLTASLAVTACGGGETSGDEDFPERQVRITIPFDPGGGSDVMARLVEQYWDDEFDQGLEFDYLSGAGGTVGMTSFLGTAQNDGHDIITFNFPHIILHPEAGLAEYHWSDYELIGEISSEYVVLVVPEGSPYETLDDFVEDVEANPGSISASIPQAMDAGHVAYSQFHAEIDGELPLVAYQSGSEQLDGLLSGDTDVAFGATGTMINAIRGGDVRVLAVSSAESLEVFPEWETFQEQGYDVESYLGRLWLAPEGTDEERLERLREGFQNIAETEGFIEEMANLGIEVEFRDADELTEIFEDFEAGVSELVEEMEEVEE